jgi:hypothetical protein
MADKMLETTLTTVMTMHGDKYGSLDLLYDPRKIKVPAQRPVVYMTCIAASYHNEASDKCLISKVKRLIIPSEAPSKVMVLISKVNKVIFGMVAVK